MGLESRFQNPGPLWPSEPLVQLQGRPQALVGSQFSERRHSGMAPGTLGSRLSQPSDSTGLRERFLNAIRLQENVFDVTFSIKKG